MKKLTLLAILAIMLIGMLAFAACKAQEEQVPEETTTEEVQPVTVDTTVQAVGEAAEAVKEVVK